jgi:hypothetical protein
MSRLPLLAALAALLITTPALPQERTPPQAEKPKTDKPKADKPKTDKPKTEKPGKDGPKGPRPLFASNDVLHLTIKAPFGSIIRGAIPAETAQPGTLTVAGAKPETLAVTLAPRGITRRKKDVCPFPPLAVAFPEKPPKGSLFQGQKKLKLVTHCKPAPAFQQYVLMEYAAYKLNNAITPQSFNARLAQIDYVDASGKPVTTRMGFFIEDGDDMAERNGMVEEQMPDRIPVSTLDPKSAARYALFQYMISNLDWAMNAGPPGAGCCHNARLIGPKGATTNIIPVPYDFDYSGLVDAPYAVPPAQIQVANVRTRRWRGFCRHNAEVGPAAAAMLADQGRLLAVIDSIPDLEPGTRNKAKSFLGGFFETIGSPAELQDKLIKNCLGQNPAAPTS